MSEPFIGEIRAFGGNYAPRGWALCAGQTIAITENSALFAVIGTYYGGDGRTTFKLPDLRGRVVMGVGQGLGLQNIPIGAAGGQQTTTLSLAQMPIHNHAAVFTPTGGGGPLSVTVNVPVADAGASQSSPAGNIPAQSQQPGRTPVPVDSYAPTSAATGNLGGVTTTVSGGGITGGTVTVGNNGGSQPLEILPPYVGINYIIALQGIFPARN